MNYKIWECLVCGLLYDESKGWPEDNIAPGTRWEDVPDDWECPDCGVGKEDFEMVEVTSDSADSENAPAAQRPVVIIGTGLAGYNLAREFRTHDPLAPLIMLTADDGRYYSKPNLSTAYAKGKTADDLATASSQGMAANLNAQVLVNTEVDSIDTATQQLTAGGQVIDYEKLVIAMGASSIAAPLSGSGLDRVYSINNLTDYDVFRQAMQGKKKVLIIGAGLIGSEYANDMIASGFDVEAVEPMTTVLGSLLPAEASAAVQSRLEHAGVRYHFNTVVERVDSAGDGILATLANGDEVAADLVLSAIGVRPDLDLAKRAGLATNRGIVTNRSLQTSAPNVYALGDCAEVDGHLLYYIAPLNAAAKVLARVLCGQTAEVDYGVMPVLVKTTLCPVVVSPPGIEATGEWQIEGAGDNISARYISPEGEQLGFALTGEATKERTALGAKNRPLMTKTVP